MIKIILTQISKLFLIWFTVAVLLIIAWLGGDDLNNRAVAMATLLCGLITLNYWQFGRSWFRRFITSRPWPKWLKVLITGLTGAIIIETVFWFCEETVGAIGLSINSNLLITFVLTLPVYALLILIFWWVQKKYLYTTSEILILGGVYQLGSEIIMGTLFRDSFLWGLVYGLIGLPIFMIVYSVMMLPLATLIKSLRPANTPRGSKIERRLWGLLPLIGLLPFFLWYFII